MVRAVRRERVRVMEQHRSQPHPEGLLYLSWPRVGMTKACPYSAHGAAVAWLIRGPLGNCSAHATSSSFAVPSRAASYSRLWPEGLRGQRGGHARTTRTAWQRAAPPAWSAKIGSSKQASAEHRKTVCMHAHHARICIQQNDIACRHAVQSKQCIGHRPTLPCLVLVSSRPLHFRWICAHT